MQFNTVTDLGVDNLSREPPYECPIVPCNSSFQNATAAKIHLLTCDHVNECVINDASEAEGSLSKRNTSDSQFLYNVECDGNLHSLDIRDQLPLLSQGDYIKTVNGIVNGTTRRKRKVDVLPTNIMPSSSVNYNLCNNEDGSLREPAFKSIALSPKRRGGKKLNLLPEAQIYYRRPTTDIKETLENDVEYEMDELDCSWISVVNKQRIANNLPAVTENVFEAIIDKLEKEAFLSCQTQNSQTNVIDDDAVCSICLDGECQNTNVILFCDACNIAVHQECYGVPYVPEGQWLCRRCLQSPVHSVDCCLCPNSGSPCKQTDDGRWAHVICASWVPEVGFGNVMYMEPVCGINRIPPARWKLTCYICKQRGKGACIQCHKPNCYTAFHVTCAQLAGLYMRIEVIHSSEAQGCGHTQISKTAYCHIHSPDSTAKECDSPLPIRENLKNSPNTANSVSALQLKIKRTRSILAEKRKAPPSVAVPVISQESVEKIASSVFSRNESEFMKLVLAYWTFRRQLHNGASLLKRLQVNNASFNKTPQCVGNGSSCDLRRQYMCCRLLKREMERLHEALQLVNKRELIKCKLFDLYTTYTGLSLSPLNLLLNKILDKLDQDDSSRLLGKFSICGRKPQGSTKTTDLSSLKLKVEAFQYTSLEQFDKDLQVMFTACSMRNRWILSCKEEVHRLERLAKTYVEEANQLLESLNVDSSTSAAFDIINKPLFLPRMLDLSFIAKDTTLNNNVSLASELKTLLSEIQSIRNQQKSAQSEIEALKGLRREIALVRRKLTAHSSERETESEDDEEKTNINGVLHTPVNRVSIVTVPEANSKSLPTTTGLSFKNAGSPSRRSSRGNTPVHCLDSPEKTDSLNTRKRCLNGLFIEPQSLSPECKRRTNGYGHVDIEAKKLMSPKPIITNHELTSAIVLLEPLDHVVLGFDINGRKNGMPSESLSTDTESLASLPSSPKYLQRGKKHRSKGTIEDQKLSTDVGMLIDQFVERSQQHWKLRLSIGEDDATANSTADDSSISSNDVSLHNESQESKWVTNDTLRKVTVKAMDIVWAKCAGYAWYPALVVDPDPSSPTQTHNGLHLPRPSPRVLRERRSCNEPLYLVLFFDNRRTWQWLTRSKMQPLGLNAAVDSQRVIESKDLRTRQDVLASYKRAVAHYCATTGDPNPLLLRRS